MPFTALSDPGTFTFFPFSSRTIFPVMGFPSRFTLPRSRISNAMALARRVEVVFEIHVVSNQKIPGSYCSGP